MVSLPDRRLALYALAALAIVAFAVRAATRGGEPKAPAAREPAPIRVERGESRRLTVHVAGLVRRPGVYRLRAGSRVQDAISRAGGARPRGDLGALNLAAELEDGRQVLVPARAAAAGAAGAAALPPPVPAEPGAAAAAGAGTGAAPPGPPINLNTATIEQLDQLEGIGPGIAQKILAYRQEHGGFSSVDELKRVPGIGETRFATLRERVTA
jgi:competence protein ComEA